MVERMSVEFSESLLGDSQLATKDLQALFNQDNVRDLHKASKVSVSLHRLETKMMGVKGVAQSLQSDILVFGSSNFRMVYLALRRTSRSGFKGTAATSRRNARSIASGRW